MAICEVCSKGSLSGRRISINRSQVSKRAKRKFKPNIRSIKAVVNGSNKTLKVCTSCLRSGKVTRAI